MPALPSPRGPITETLFAALRGPAGALPPLPAPVTARPEADEDLQLALYCCYELHYRGFSGVDERWEWAPAMLAARAGLEAPFEARLAELAPLQRFDRHPGEMDVVLREIAAADDGPSVARLVESRACEEQLLEFLVHRSGYQLKEADPHS